MRHLPPHCLSSHRTKNDRRCSTLLDGKQSQECLESMTEESLPDLLLEEHHYGVFSLDFHPSNDVIALGLMNGQCNVYQYTPTGHNLLYELNHHHQACRSCRFFVEDGGSTLATCSSDRSILIVDSSGNLKWRAVKAHSSPVNVIEVWGSSSIYSGDDSGVIKIWDIRSHDPVAVFDSQSSEDDYISALHISPDGKTLVAASGGGTLGVYDIRQRKKVQISEELEQDLTSIAAVKNNSVLAIGTTEGFVTLWNWGEWGNPVENFPGHPGPVNDIIALDDDTIATASDDGLIRVIQLRPNKFLGILGHHSDFPCESISVSRDMKWMASVSHSLGVKFDFVGFLGEEWEGEGEGEGDSVANSVVVPNDSEMDVDTPTPKGDGGNDSSDEDEDVEESKPCRENSGRKKGRKKAKRRGENARNNSQRRVGNFFDGMQ